VGPRENEAAGWILESGGGWLVGEDRVDDLLAAVREASDPAARAERGARARAFARERFSREANCARIADLLEAAAAGRASTRPASSRG
jgi:hypothetical protein